MSDAVRFLTGLTQALSASVLYGEGHPAYRRAADSAFRQLKDLQSTEGVHLDFSLLDGEVVFRDRVVHELRTWDWTTRFAEAGIQRIEVTGAADAEEFEDFLDQLGGRLAGQPLDSSSVRHDGNRSIRFGHVSVQRDQASVPASADAPAVSYGLQEECQAIHWVHDEVTRSGRLPLLEAEMIVQSLSIAMHAERASVLPLLQLKEFDQYTTTHSMNVAVLAMALAESLEVGSAQVRAVGVAGLLHDLGKVRVSKDVLLKPGKLTEAERAEIQRHPVEGARVLLAGDQPLDLAAVVAYEHHLMMDGSGYPCRHSPREAHYGSRLVHICDVYDALRTKRPYRDAWDSEKTLQYIEERAGLEFDPALTPTFIAMIRRWDHRVMAVPPVTTDLHDTLAAGSIASVPQGQ
jgi:putative nucleotidyltransferase with HDIG domain